MVKILGKIGKMPKSKNRGRTVIAHYNPNSGVLHGKLKQARYGKKAAPVPGTRYRIERRSEYMGSRILPEQRLEYMKKQEEVFKDKYLKDIIKKRSDIESQEDKTEEEIRLEIDKFNKEQITERELELLAKRFARFQHNKEQKHFKSWLKGESTYVYHEQTFPVLTERFLKQTQSIKDIVKVESDGKDTKDVDGQGVAESGLDPSISADSAERDRETL